jgi:hypothetical protein
MRLPWKRTSESAVAQNSDADTVRAKIVAVEQEVQSAEADLRAISLEAALSGSPDAGHDAIARLNQLRSKRELLTNALQAAEQAERDRLAALHAREMQARKRSLAQKLGAYEREAGEVAKATQALNDAKARMSETALSIAPLLPRQLRTGAKPWDQLVSPLMVNQLALLEAYRLDPRAKKPDRLANHYPNFQDRVTGRVKPIGEITAELCTNLKADFERCGLPAEQSPAAPLQTAAPDTSGIVIDMRGVDLGIEKKVKDEPTNEEEQAVSADKPLDSEVTADA